MTLKLAVVGGGWAGMAAAVSAAGPDVELTVFEAARELGGRARALQAMRPDGVPLRLDNGQHILIGAYRQALSCMQQVGVPLSGSLLALPLGLPFPDGSGLQTPAWASRWPGTLALLAAMATARGWSWSDRLALIRVAARWQRQGFACAPSDTVARLCDGLTAQVMADLIEPLCVSALNLPTRQASGQIFLRVMRDALLGEGFGGWRASSLLLPLSDLGNLFPESAARWLADTLGARFRLCLGTRVAGLRPDRAGWHLQGTGIDDHFDQVIWATSASSASQVMHQTATEAAGHGGGSWAQALKDWADTCSRLSFTAITTVYTWSPGLRLDRPMLALRDAPEAPAQFVFDRGQLSPQDPAMQGVLAFVVSASQGDRATLEHAVLRQARDQLGASDLQPIQTVVEKRATFACTPGLRRPGAQLAPGLQAAGDFLEGPYPATLEAAVRAGVTAGAQVRARVDSSRGQSLRPV